MLKLSKKDIKGVMSFPPTPGKPNADRWDCVDSVDLDKTVLLENKLIASGVGVITHCGTTGENMSLLWDEKREFIATAVKTINKRVPVFAGCTALGTKEVIRQMRVMKDLGADGAFIGLPLWQTPTIENSIQWYTDFSEAMPDFPVLVYANASFFKSTFPTALWAGIGKRAPTILGCKGGTGPEFVDKVKACAHQVQMVPSMLGAVTARKQLKDAGMDPSYIQCLWSTDMFPEPWVALADAINKADEQRIEEIKADIEGTQRHSTPELSKKYNFAEYNTQVEHHSANASGYLPGGFGPNRPPYRDIPEEWKAHIHNPERVAKWQNLVKKYSKTPAK